MPTSSTTNNSINALHILCEEEEDEPDLEIFNLVLSLRDIDVNQIRFDGKTPFKLLEENYKIDVEKKMKY